MESNAIGRFRRLFDKLEFEPPGWFIGRPALVSFIVKFRRRSMKYAASRSTMKRKTQAPTMPPNSLPFIPDVAGVLEVVADDVVAAGNFAIGVNKGVVEAGVGTGL